MYKIYDADHKNRLCLGIYDANCKKKYVYQNLHNASFNFYEWIFYFLKSESFRNELNSLSWSSIIGYPEFNVT